VRPDTVQTTGGDDMPDFNSQNKAQKWLLIIAGTLFLMAIIMTFARYVMLALIVALAAVLILFVSKAVTSSMGANNAPKDLPEHVEDMSRRS
jgi:type III secretory pathway component EscV